MIASLPTNNREFIETSPPTNIRLLKDASSPTYNLELIETSPLAYIRPFNEISPLLINRWQLELVLKPRKYKLPPLISTKPL